jgi:hypothetical protein
MLRTARHSSLFALTLLSFALGLGGEPGGAETPTVKGLHAASVSGSGSASLMSHAARLLTSPTIVSRRIRLPNGRFRARLKGTP